ncbi:MAG: GNAT family N-acetyltransferase [Candidatus Micrarchaeota archaeon]
MISLRRVVAEDIRMIFEWRNHPLIRSRMFDSSELKLENHVAYWQKKLADPYFYSFIISSGGQEVGFAKLEKMEDGYDVGIFINPSKQKKGMGTEAISAIIAEARKIGIKKLIARIKPDNVASQKIFEKNKFVAVYQQYELDLGS